MNAQLNASWIQSLAFSSLLAATGLGCHSAPEAPEVFVPAGRFTAGADCNSKRVEPGCDGALLAHSDSRHSVFLNAFEVDRNLVTDAEYNRCVQWEHCAPQAKVWCSYNGGDYSDFGWNLAAVSYRDAQAYCRWRGKRLPSYYEFERIAQRPQGVRSVTHFAQWVNATSEGYPDGLLRGLSQFSFQAHRPEDFRDEDGVTRAFFRCALTTAQ